MKTFLFLTCLAFLNSCILPIPHRRVHIQGIEGQVIDAKTRAPITRAQILSYPSNDVVTLTNAKGRYKIKPVYGWHGAYLIGPVSYSMFPHFDIPNSYTNYWVTADGYVKKRISNRGVTPLNRAPYKGD